MRTLLIILFALSVGQVAQAKSNSFCDPIIKKLRTAVVGCLGKTKFSDRESCILAVNTKIGMTNEHMEKCGSMFPQPEEWAKSKNKNIRFRRGMFFLRRLRR